MHSSRMHTVRNSSRLPGGAWSGGCLLWGMPGSGGVPGLGGSALGGCLVFFWGGCGLLLGGAWSGGEGVSAPGRSWGVCSQGVGIPACTDADPPVNIITDRCKIQPSQLCCGRQKDVFFNSEIVLCFQSLRVKIMTVLTSCHHQN